MGGLHDLSFEKLPTVLSVCGSPYISTSEAGRLQLSQPLPASRLLGKIFNIGQHRRYEIASSYDLQSYFPKKWDVEYLFLVWAWRCAYVFRYVHVCLLLCVQRSEVSLRCYSSGAFYFVIFDTGSLKLVQQTLPIPGALGTFSWTDEYLSYLLMRMWDARHQECAICFCLQGEVSVLI